MSGNLHILFVEDQAHDAELCEHELRRAGIEFTAERVCTRATYERALAEFAPDLILSDFSMPTDLDGFSALSIAREKAIEVPFVFVSGTIGEERAVEAMKAGATDYVLKDKLERLGPIVRRALDEAHQRRVARQAQNALMVSEATFRSFMQHLPGRASIRDLEGRYTYVNGLWEQAFGLRAEDVVGQPCDEVWDTKRGEELKRVHDKVVETNAPVKRLLKRGSGERAKWWLAHQFPVPDPDGAPSMVGTIAIDVTEQKLQEEKLARLGRIHAVLSGVNSAIVHTHDNPNLLKEVCRTAVEDGGFGGAWVGLYDHESGEVRTLASAGLDDGEEGSGALILNGRPTPHGMIARVIAKGRPSVCNRITDAFAGAPHRRQEALRRGFRSIVVLPLCSDDQVVGIVSLLAREPNSFSKDELKLLMQLAHDVSFALEYIEKEERLTYLAWHDPVTGLANRALLCERLSEALDAARRNQAGICVLVWDVKRFRTINDTYGRDVGDGLLRELAKRMTRHAPELAHMARLSADYFAAYIVNAGDASQMAHLLESAAVVLGQPFVVDGNEIAIGISMGVAVFPHDGSGADTLLSNAEEALKQAKTRGDPYLFYETAMNARVAEKLSLEVKLRRALEKNQFVLHYQPKIDLETLGVSGYEALIRWNDPETGLVPPMDFIPLLEETGLILEVGRWALGKALEDWRERVQRGLPAPRIAVNVSAMQLRQADFVDVVAKALDVSGGGAHGIDLEITESLLMEDIAGNAGKVHALKEMGVNIAIDDFGTGYSSLSYLAKLPVDALKIDRAFIETMADEPQSMTIVSTIISLAHALHMVVVAEGVETARQAELLRQLGCDQAQGFHFSRPLPWAGAFPDEPVAARQS